MGKRLKIFLVNSFCRYIVPKLAFLKYTGFYLDSYPKFKHIGKGLDSDPYRPCIEASYTNKYGAKARLRIEILND